MEDVEAALKVGEIAVFSVEQVTDWGDTAPPAQLVTSTVAVLGETACPGLIPERERKVEDSAGAVGYFSRGRGGGGLDLKGRETDAAAKNGKLGEDLLCVRAAAGR